MSPTLRALAVAEQRVVDAHKELAEAERVLKDLRLDYAKERPLTQAEHDAIVKRFESGGALCCEEGLKWLRKVVPEPWAQSINGWAYSIIGCSPPSESTRIYWLSKVRALKLDCLPRSDW